MPLAAIASLVIAGAGSSEAAAQGTAAPAAGAVRIAFEPPALDFGIVAPNVAPSGSVQIRNLGTSPVHIKSMKPTCKCTTLEDLTGTAIPPGGTATLTARLDARSVAGKRSESVRVVLAESEQIFEVAVIAEVTLPVRINPSILNLASGQLTGHVVVESVTGKPFHVLAANGKPPRYVGFDPDLDELQNSYVLEWDLTGESKAGKLPRWFVIETDHEACPLVDVWVRDRSTIETPQRDRRWRVVDMRVLLGVLPPGGSKEFTVEIEELGSASIAAVRSLTPAIDARLVNVERTGANALVKVLVTAKPETRGVFLGRVEFMSSSGTQGLDVIGKVAP
jgi:hypothetical protein